MLSSQRFGSSPTTLNLTVGVDERVRVTTDDASHLITVCCKPAGGGKEAMGGCSYGGVQGGVPIPGDYTIHVSSGGGGPGTVVVEANPTLPQ